MDKSIKRTILSSSLITFGIVLGIVYVTLLVLTWFFPIVIAEMNMQVGNENLASYYYNLDYNKSGDLNSIYKALRYSIDSKNYANIEKYYAKMQKNEDYSDFIIETNILNSKLKINNLAKSFILNEDDYLKSNYVNALLRNCKKEKALKYAIDNFRTANPTNFDLIKFEDCLKYTMTSEIYLLDAFVSEEMLVEDIKIFTNTHNDKYISSLVSEIFALSNIYVDIFNKALEEISNNELTPYIMMCGNMSLELCNNIVTIYENAINNNITINLTQSQYEDVKLIIVNLNNQMQKLVENNGIK